MEMKVDSNLLRQLRQQHAWSQDELATAAGLSLRTIQRIETDGTTSLESRKALAAVFGIEASALEDRRERLAKLDAHLRRQKRRGFVGAAVGCASGFAGISYAMVRQHLPPGDAGLYYAGVAAFVGVSCALIAKAARKAAQA